MHTYALGRYYWKGGTENKEKLIKHCNRWWSLYKLEEGEKWRKPGTLNYNTLLQLVLFLRKEGKWDKVSYADMFFTFRDHPEWQRDCRMGPPQDPLVLTSERDKKRKNGKGVLSRVALPATSGKDA